MFRGYEEIRDATFVKAGQGLTIERRGTRAGHQYQLLGHSPHGPVMVEPYIIMLTAESDVFPTFQHAGLEFLYMLEGEVVYRHGDKTYDDAAGRCAVLRCRRAAWAGGIAQAADPLPLRDQLPPRGVRDMMTQTIVPAREGRAVKVGRGQTIRITTPKGAQAADFFAYNAETLGEWLSANHTWVTTFCVKPREGDVFISRFRRPMLRFVRGRRGWRA